MDKGVTKRAPLEENKNFLFYFVFRSLNRTFAEYLFLILIFQNMKENKIKVAIPNYRSRDDYKNKTKEYLNQVKNECKKDSERRDAIRHLLVKLYNDLLSNIKNEKNDKGAINDDAIEGILAIADTCIEEQNLKRNDNNAVEQLEEDLNSILKNDDSDSLSEEENVKAKVNAFYSLCTKHRRIKDFVKYRGLVNHEYDKKVCNDVIFQIMTAYYYIQETSKDFNTKHALKCWRDKIDPVYKRLPAFTQIYTETVVLQCESTNEPKLELLNEAETLLQQAINTRNYPKFYSTRGRIYCCEGKYDDGIAEVRAAIELEDSDRKDYFARINEYQSLISRFQREKDEKELKEQANKIMIEIENSRAEMEKSKTNYISFLGFFSGIMALIIGGINLVNVQSTIDNSLQLLMGLAGLIIISFGSLNLMLVRRDEKSINKYSDWTLVIIGACIFVLLFIVRILCKYQIL